MFSFKSLLQDGQHATGIVKDFLENQDFFFNPDKSSTTEVKNNLKSTLTSSQSRESVKSDITNASMDYQIRRLTLKLNSQALNFTDIEAAESKRITEDMTVKPKEIDVLQSANKHSESSHPNNADNSETEKVEKLCDISDTLTSFSSHEYPLDNSHNDTRPKLQQLSEDELKLNHNAMQTSEIDSGTSRLAKRSKRKPVRFEDLQSTNLADSSTESGMDDFQQLRLMLATKNAKVSSQKNYNNTRSRMNL